MLKGEVSVNYLDVFSYFFSIYKCIFFYSGIDYNFRRFQLFG